MSPVFINSLAAIIHICWQTKTQVGDIMTSSIDLGIHDRHRSLLLIYPILHTNNEPDSPQNQPENRGGGGL